MTAVIEITLDEIAARGDVLRSAVRVEYGRRSQKLRSLYRDLAARSVPGIEDSQRAVERSSVASGRRKASPEAWATRALAGQALPDRGFESDLQALLSLEALWPASVGWTHTPGGPFTLRLGRDGETWREANGERTPVRGRIVLADGAGELLVPCGSRAATEQGSRANPARLWVALFPAPELRPPGLEELVQTLRARTATTLRSGLDVAAGEPIEARC